MPLQPFRLALLLVACSAPVLAQPQVQRDFYQGDIRQQGEAIRFCVWPQSPLVEFDRAVAAELAAIQLLEPQVFEVPVAHVGTQDLFEQQLFIDLMDNCDAAMGTSLDWKPLPQWLTITRPYVEIPQVLVARAPGVDSLSDLPTGARLGSVLFTQADMGLVTALQQWPAAQRPVRIPFGTPAEVLAAVQDGVVAAGIVPAPALVAQAGEPLPAAILVEPTIPPVAFGMALLSRERYLGQVLDQAIAALVADGTLARLMAEHGLSLPR